MATWVLVADRVGARIFDRISGKLVLIETIEFSGGRTTDHDLEAGRSHRTFDSHASGHDPRTSLHEHAALHFARQLATRLREARMAETLTSIVLVSEPRFLGLLKSELDHTTHAMVAATIPKNLAGANVADVQSHLNAAHAPLG